MSQVSKDVKDAEAKDAQEEDLSQDRSEQEQDVERKEDDEKQEKRRKWAQLFALVCFVLAVMWIAKRVPEVFPHEVFLQYVYEGIQHPEQIQQIDVSVYPKGAKKAYAQATYFHHGPLKDLGRQTKRRQRMRLSKGAYRAHVRILYKTAPQSILTYSFRVREGGTFFVRLKKAKPGMFKKRGL